MSQLPDPGGAHPPPATAPRAIRANLPSGPRLVASCRIARRSGAMSYTKMQLLVAALGVVPSDDLNRGK